MKRAVTPTLISLGILVLVAWIVNNAGERFRRSAHDTATEIVRTAGDEPRRTVDHTGDKASEPAKATGENVEKTFDKSSETTKAGAKEVGGLMDKSAKVSGEVSRDLPGEGQDHTPSSPPQEGSPENSAPFPPDRSPDDGNTQNDVQIAEAPPAPANPLPTESDPPRASAPKRAPVDATGQEGASDPVETIFKQGESFAKALDSVGQEAFALSEADEIRVGREVHLMVIKETKAWQAALVKKRVEQLAKPILELRARKNIRYTFTLLDDPECNAFSHLGGYIYINRGLLDRKPSDAELQFVIGHEIAHVDLKHCVKQLTYAARASGMAGEPGARIVQVAYQMIALGYSKEKEFEADAWSYKSLRQLRRSKEECLAFLQRMGKEERTRRIQQADPTGDNAADQVVVQVRNHFQSHPPTTERIKNLERLP